MPASRIPGSDPLHPDPLNRDPLNRDPLNRDPLNRDPRGRGAGARTAAARDCLAMPVLALMLLAMPGCSARQAYDTGQAWQRNACNKLADTAERERCLNATNTSYEAYRRAVERETQR